jgi:hypothetical protein
VSSGEFVHTTLFRYREPLARPAALLELIAGLDPAAGFRVEEFMLVREIVFPSLEYQVLHDFPVRN